MALGGNSKYLMVPTRERANHQCFNKGKSMYKYILPIILLSVFLVPAQAAEWDARTTRTNTAVTDADIQMALSQGINPEFVRVFPIRQYGIHVLVDRHTSAQFWTEIVYFSLGLCRRQPDGTYELAEGSYSDLVLLPLNTPPDKQRQAVGQKLTAMAAAFTQGMVQHKQPVPSRRR